MLLFCIIIINNKPLYHCNIIIIVVYTIISFYYHWLQIGGSHVSCIRASWVCVEWSDWLIWIIHWYQ